MNSIELVRHLLYWWIGINLITLVVKSILLTYVRGTVSIIHQNPFELAMPNISNRLRTTSKRHKAPISSLDVTSYNG